jgi:hypothetical protein
MAVSAQGCKRQYARLEAYRLIRIPAAPTLAYDFA